MRRLMPYLTFALAMVICVGCSMRGWHGTTDVQVYQAAVGANMIYIIPILGPPSADLTLPNGEHAYTWMTIDGTVISANRYRATGIITQKYCRKMLFVRANGTVYGSKVEGNAHDCQ